MLTSPATIAPNAGRLPGHLPAGSVQRAGGPGHRDEGGVAAHHRRSLLELAWVG